MEYCIEKEVSKDNVGTFYKVIIDANKDKIKFYFPQTREIEKRTFFGKKKIIKEDFVEVITTNVYAEKKDDGIYESITNKKIHSLPHPEDDDYDINFLYCESLKKLSTEEEISQMNKEKEILSKLDRRLLEETISEASHHAVIGFWNWNAILNRSASKHKKSHNSSSPQNHLKLMSNEEIVKQIEESLYNLQDGKVKSIGRYKNY